MRRAGVLCHITSLPGASWHGTLGGYAREFVDMLAGYDIRVWQMLSVNPPDEYDSPYAATSAFAFDIGPVFSTFGSANSNVVHTYEHGLGANCYWINGEKSMHAAI